MKCRACGCTDEDCSGCVARTGEPCSWAWPELCSACVCSWRAIEGDAFENQYGDRLVRRDGWWVASWCINPEQPDARRVQLPVLTPKAKKWKRWNQKLWAQIHIENFRHNGGSPLT